ncbi:MAG: hypothetical protein JXM70_19875, partial [Pirellulales bacterium]|nr:hypothetical protein [Pirellulales bacterium]
MFISVHTWRILTTTSVRLAVVVAVAWTLICTAGNGDTGTEKHTLKSQSVQESSSDHATRPLRFIRVYSPADKPEHWPRGQGRYLPVDSHDFERLLKDAGASAVDSSVPKTNVAQAEYRAYLDENGMLCAAARLQIINNDGKPLLLPLEPFIFAINSPRWISNESDSGKKEPAAVLGTDQSGRTALLVERSGEFLFDCTIPGRKTRQNGVNSGKVGTLNDASEYTDIEFELELPKCPKNVLLLDIPKELIPQTDQGIINDVNHKPDISTAKPLAESVKELSATPTTAPPISANLKRWRIDLGGHNRLKLRFVRSGATGDTSPAVNLTQSLVYDFNERGLEVSSDFRLDVPNVGIDRIELTVDSPLRIIRAQCGDQPVDWSEISDADGKTGRVSLELPETVHGTGRSIQVLAYGPLITDRAWHLPRIRVRNTVSENGAPIAGNIFWEQGNATLLVSEPLQLLDIKTTDCRLSKSGRLPSPATGESLQLQLFSADARPQVIISRAESQPLVDLGIATRLDAGDMTALVTAQLHNKRQEQFNVEAKVASQWIVDSVQSQPPEVLADWRVQSNGSGSQRLAIRLDRPLSPKRGTLRLVIGLRHPRSPLGRKLSINDLVPLAFVNCKTRKSLLAINTVQPHQLKTWGKASMSLAEAGSLDADDLSLFSQPPQGLVAATREAAGSLRVSLERQRPSYDAEIRVEARVEGELLLESYQIRCIPQSSSVECVLIHFSRIRPSALRWRLGSEDDQHIMARRLPAAEEAAAGLDGEGETWEISLRRPRNASFEISASRSTKINEETAVCLAALPEASQQKATLVILANDTTDRRFQNHRLEPIPSKPVDPETYSTVRATYRYNPLRTVSSSEQAELTVLPIKSQKAPSAADDEDIPDPILSSAWIWASHIDSSYNPDGTVRNSARFLIENAGRDQLNLILPEKIDPDNVHGIWVNDESVTWQTSITENGCSLRVDLPAQQRFPVVTVHFTTHYSRLGFSQSLNPVMPEADIPILQRYWTAWIPPGYAPLVGDHYIIHGYAPSVSRPSLTQRIFGPIGRPLHANTFDPFLFGDWKNVAGSFMDLSQNKQAVEVMLERIGRLSRQIPQDETIWGNIFSNESFGAVERPILIEADAFSQAGISPNNIDTSSQASQSSQLPPAPMPPDLKSLVPATQNGISAEDALDVSSTSNEEAMARAIRLLRRWGMVVLAHDDAIVLTTSARAAVYASHLKPCGCEVVRRVLPGPLSEWISTSTANRGANEQTTALVPASKWAASPDKRKSPWQTSMLGALTATDTPGWTAVQLDITGKKTVGVTVVHLQTLEIFRWTAFILAIALGWWKAADKPAHLSMGLAIAAILALLTPIVISTTASGICLGLLFCLILRLIRRNHASEDSNSTLTKAEPSPSHTTAAYVSSSVVLALVMLLPNILKAQTPEADANPSGDLQKTYRVLVPSNEKHEATGGRVFVPEEFYRQLHLRAATATGRPQGWLLTSAIYRGAFVRKGQPEQLAIDELKAVFDIRLFDREAQVRIPLKKQDVSLVQSACLLDGHPVPATWNTDGRSLLVPVREAGKHRLDLSLKPVAKQIPTTQKTTNGTTYTVTGKTTGDNIRNALNETNSTSTGGELDIAIPRLNNSRLEFILPVGQNKVEVNSARGQVTNQNGLLTAELGGGDRLSMRWNDVATRPQAKPSIKAEELLWLKILPGSVVVDAKFSIKVDAGSVSMFTLEADPRLRLLEQGNTADIVKVPGKPYLRTINLKQPCTNEVLLTASFLLRDASGVGNVRPPVLRLANVPAATRRMAVTIDKALKSTSLDSNNKSLPKSTPVSEFMAAWGISETKPQAVFSTSEIGSNWSISTQPRRPLVEIVQTLAVTFGQKQTELQLDAKITDTPGYGLKYRLTTPADVVIEKVSLIEEGAERVSRWSRANDGTLTIFLTGPAAVERNLSLQGHITTPLKGKIDVPVFHLENSRAGSTRIALLRNRSVLVSIVKSTGLIESDWPSVLKTPDAFTDGHELSLPRPVKSFIANGLQPPELQVSLAPNIPKTNMVQSTIMAPGGGPDGAPWTATVDLQITVSSGILDEVI